MLADVFYSLKAFHAEYNNIVVCMYIYKHHVVLDTKVTACSKMNLSSCRVTQYMLYCRCGRLDFLCLHTLSRGGGERGEAAGHVGATEGRVGGRAQGSRDDQQRASQDGAHGGRGQAAGSRGRPLHNQPAGRLQRGRDTCMCFNYKCAFIL